MAALRLLLRVSGIIPAHPLRLFTAGAPDLLLCGTVFPVRNKGDNCLFI
jgi:hypothetical protein